MNIARVVTKSTDHLETEENNATPCGAVLEFVHDIIEMLFLKRSCPCVIFSACYAPLSLADERD
jgi:hypothetical protein